MNHISFIYSSVDEHLSFFYVLAIVNSASGSYFFYFLVSLGRDVRLTVQIQVYTLRIGLKYIRACLCVKCNFSHMLMNPVAL